MVGRWTLAGAVAVGLAAGRMAASEEPVSPQDIAAAVARLRDDRLAVRDEAADFLWRAGSVARVPLEGATKGDDARAAARAELILERLRYGFTADTPPDAVELIVRFRDGDLAMKSDVLKQLCDRGLLDNAVALAKLEPAAVHAGAARDFLRTISGRAVDALVEGRPDMAERLLACAASLDAYGAQHRDYAAVLLFRGRLAEAIEALKSSGASRPGADDAALLARLLVVAGSVAEARPLVEAGTDKHLKIGFYQRCADWTALALEDLASGDQGLERLGFSAVINRLARRDAECDEAVAKLQALAAEQPDKAWMCTEALLIAGRWQAAVELFSDGDRHSAFDVLCARMKPAEAFALIGIEDPCTGSAGWFRARAAALAATPRDLDAHFFLGLSVARALCHLGETEEADRLLEAAGGIATAEAGTRLRALFETAHELGLRGRADRLAVDLLATEQGASSVIRARFPKTAALVQLWWTCFRRWHPGDDGPATLQRVKEFLTAGNHPADSPPSLTSICERAEREGANLQSFQRLAWLRGLAETCVMKGDAPLGITYLEKEAEEARALDAGRERDSNGHLGHAAHQALIRIGDVHAGARRWPEAAAAYRRAAAIDGRRPLPLYLEGHALAQAGEVDRGRALMQLASMLPLGDTAGRQELAEGLEARGLEQAADTEWETILRLGDFGSWEGSSAWAVKTAAKNRGNRLVGTDPLHAAALFQHMLMYLLKTNSSFLNPSDYVDVVHAIHRVRARGLVARGEVAAAWWDIEQAQAAQPGDADFVADMATHLAAAGRAADAERVFADCFAAYERICSGFPRSAQHHNGLAWLAARCGRRLDDARRHAETAVQLDPGRAAYLDTLAEVHFRLGDRERAIALEKQAVDREPKNPEFRERLKRFERGD